MPPGYTTYARACMSLLLLTMLAVIECPYIIYKQIIWYLRRLPFSLHVRGWSMRMLDSVACHVRSHDRPCPFFLIRDDIFEIERRENRSRLEEGIEESTSWDYRQLIVRIVYTFLYSLYECYSNVKSFNLQDKLFNRLILFLLAFRSLSRLIFRLPRLS